MRIEVTANDIAKGAQDDCEACPVARAVRRATGLPAEVDSVRITLDRNGPRRQVLPTPKDVETFIYDFDGFDAEEEDAESYVKPFAFDLDVTP